MKIAIVKLSALGDIIHAMVVLQFIKQHQPETVIDWIVEEGFKGVLEHNPHINHIHTVNLRAVKQQKSPLLLFKELRKIRKFGQYDLVIDAQGLIKSAIVSKILKSTKVSGFDSKSIRESIASKFYNHTTSIAFEANTIERNIAVICNPLSISISSLDIVNKKLFLIASDKYDPPYKKYIVLVIGSTWDSRNYPKEKFVQVVEELKVKCLVIWGNNFEREKANWMASQSSNINVLPKLNLNELKSVIQQSSLLIGNDTGPTHMAWGLNTPSITLFGPTPVNRIYQTSINRAIKSDSKVDHYKLNKNDFSIKDIKVDDIVKMAQNLLGLIK